MESFTSRLYTDWQTVTLLNRVSVGRFYAVQTARVIFTAKTSFEVFSLGCSNLQ